jgi:hypothetical protein
MDSPFPWSPAFEQLAIRSYCLSPMSEQQKHDQPFRSYHLRGPGSQIFQSCLVRLGLTPSFLIGIPTIIRRGGTVIVRQ